MIENICYIFIYAIFIAHKKTEKCMQITRIARTSFNELFFSENLNKFNET